MINKELFANQSHFHLNVQNCHIPMFVKTFSTQDVGLGQHYFMLIKLHSAKYLHLPEYLEKWAIFTVNDSINPQVLYGYLTDLQGPVNAFSFGQSIFEWDFTLESPLYPLRKKKRSRAFRNMSVDEIIRHLLEEYHFRRDNYLIQFTDIYPKRPLTVQYHETDLNFFQRLLEHYGLFYRFNNDGLLTITDDITLLDKSAIELPFQFLTGQEKLQHTAFKIKTTQNTLLPKIVTLNDYNPDTPNLDLSVSIAQQSNLEIKSNGEDYRYGENYQTITEGKQLAEIRMQSYDWQRKVITLKTDFPALMPGQLITLVNTPAKNSNGNYRIITVSHFGDQTKSSIYYNTVALIPSDVPYKAPIKTVKPQGGYATATVVAINNNYLYSDMDSNGNVWIRFDFETKDVSLMHSASSVRIMQPLSGEGYGYHFPLIPGTKVLYGCINGDIDRPVIIGILSNDKTPDPVTHQNCWEHIIRTQSGNTLYMSDKLQEEKLHLFTQDQQQAVLLSNEKDDHKIRLSSQSGNMHVEAQNVQTVATKGNIQQVVGQHQTIAVQNQHQVISKSGNIQYQVQNSYQKAFENFEIQSDEGEMQVEGNIIHYDIQKKMALNAKSGDINCNAKQGKLILDSKKGIFFITKAEDIVISQPNAQLILKKDGSIFAKADVIHFKAKQFTKIQSS